MVSHKIIIIILIILIISPHLTSAYTTQRPSIRQAVEKREAPLAVEGLDQIVNFDVTNAVKMLEPILEGSEFNQALIPATLKVLMTPFGPVAKQLSRALVLMFVSTYMAADVAPSMISKITALEAPFLTRFMGPLASRELTETVDPLLHTVSNIGQVKPFVDRLLAIAGLDSVECKSVLATQAGELVRNQFPVLSRLMSSAGGRFVNDGFLKILVKSLKESSKDTQSCPQLENMIKNWHELDSRGVGDVIAEAFRLQVLKTMETYSLATPSTGSEIAPVEVSNLPM